MASWNDDGLGMTDVPTRIKDWQVPLFGCGEDSSTWIYAFFCPCIAAGEIYKNSHLGGCCTGCLIYGCCGCCCGFLDSCLVTGKIRKQRGIRGNLVGDCCANLCCRSCQQTRELIEVRDDRTEAGGHNY